MSGGFSYIWPKDWIESCGMGSVTSNKPPPPPLNVLHQQDWGWAGPWYVAESDCSEINKKTQHCKLKTIDEIQSHYFLLVPCKSVQKIFHQHSTEKTGSLRISLGDLQLLAELPGVSLFTDYKVMLKWTDPHHHIVWPNKIKGSREHAKTRKDGMLWPPGAWAGSQLLSH